MMPMATRHEDRFALWGWAVLKHLALAALGAFLFLPHLLRLAG